ncbi:HEAT repeat domain-containing protein [Prosthecobacter sp. SYSU 5D2]|uniref:HEAT repeat domain-containing protein n=1 Tax=Prosthecobacter sp. SYSU 5D2 TaxID=3134134 RepID=UPI0031FE802B
MKAVPHTVSALAAGIMLGVLACLLMLRVLDDEAKPENVPGGPTLAKEIKNHVPPSPKASAFFPSAPEIPREFRESNETDQAAWEQMEKEFWETGDETFRLEMLDQIEIRFYTVMILPFLKKIIESPQEQMSSLVRDRALELLSGNTSPEILPLLRSAIRAGDEDFRTRALLASSQVRSPDVIDFIGSSLMDPDSLVRLSVFDAVEHQTEHVRHRIYGKALMAAHPDVALQAIGELQVSSSHAGIPVLISGMNAPLAEVRQEAAAALEFLFGKSFEHPAEAAAWWEANQKRYDSELVEKD